MGEAAPGLRSSGRSRVVAWALWDCGSTGLTAIVVTFVFSVYLTSSVGRDIPGGTSASSWLGRAVAIAGLAVAVLAPLVGIWVETPRRRRVVLAVLTTSVVVLTCTMSLIRDDPSYLAAGLALLMLTTACGELASIPYNAMLRQLATPQTSGRISGFGWATGYVGSVVLLLVVYLGFVSGTGASRGWLGLPAYDGQNIRAAMLLAAAWLALFATPLLLTAHRLPSSGQVVRPRGLLEIYRKIWSDLTAEWRRDRNVVFYLLASAVFRDGVVGIFTFGAVLGVNVYGVSSADVLIFGVAASVAAAVGAVLGGVLDDRIGSKAVIVGSLTAMITTAVILMVLSGSRAFWVCGLILGLFIGPIQSSARTLLLRMAQGGPDGLEGMLFGMYTVTGRAVSFLAPWLFSVFVDAFQTDRAGMGGLCTVLTLGLFAMLAVKVPGREPHRQAVR